MKLLYQELFTQLSADSITQLATEIGDLSFFCCPTRKTNRSHERN
ncbi:hypothetical protein [Metasolibacillus sp. FSL K6-0083]